MRARERKKSIDGGWRETSEQFASSVSRGCRGGSAVAMSSFLRPGRSLLTLCWFVVVLTQTVYAGHFRLNDPYRESQVYTGSVQPAIGPSQQADLSLVFNPPYWPLTLLTDDVPVTAMVIVDEKVQERDWALVASPRVAENEPVPASGQIFWMKPRDLRDRRSGLVVGEIAADGALQLRTAHGLFTGLWAPHWDWCGLQRTGSGLSSRQIYHYFFLPSVATAVAGALIAAFIGRRRQANVRRAVLKGFVIGALTPAGSLLSLLLIALALGFVLTAASWLSSNFLPVVR